MFVFKKKLLRHWAAIRAKGLWRFVICYGVLGWGLSTAAATTLLTWVFTAALKVTDFAAISFLLFPIFGVAVGINLWRECERAFVDQRRP